MIKYGDHYNLECPWCNCVNHDVSQGVEIPPGKQVLRILDCSHCGKPMEVVLSWEIKSRAQRHEN